MPLYRWNSDKLETIPPASFEAEQLQERTDLQRLLRDQPDVLEDGLFVVAEEFSNWEESGRSIDLLALDQLGGLVVIELKRTQSGDHMELQAIRYASMVANMTLEQVIDAHSSYLQRRGSDADPAARIDEHLSNFGGPDSMIETASPRIILASAGFSKELTTSALWLISKGLDITCIKLQLYRTGADLLLDASQVIPLPEAAEYLVRLRDKEQESAGQRAHGRPESGGDAFRATIESASAEYQPLLLRLHEWAASLASEDLCYLASYVSRREGEYTLLPRLKRTNSGLVTIYNQRTGPRIQVFRSVFENLAPNSIQPVEDLLDIPIGQGNWTGNISEKLLHALTDAYREANGLSPVTIPD